MDNKVPFGEYFKGLIKEKGFTFAEFRRQIKLSKTYLIDIEKGEAYPPPELQIRMAELLKLNKSEQETFYDKAAFGRGEIPVDVFKYLYSNPEAIQNLRESMRV